MTVLLFLIALLLLFVAFMTGALIAKRKGSMPFISRPEQWSIGIYEGTSPTNLKASPAVSNPVLTASNVNDIAADFVADPFLMRTEETWYMFFEVVNTRSKRGEIAYAQSQDGRDWHYGQVVLREPFHLSYPYVFQWQQEYYMIPESHAAAAVRLYKAVDFPVSWQPMATLLHGSYDDPTLFRHDDVWWLFASNWHDKLRLFYADELLGPWVEHAQSPIQEDNMRHARPAGRIVKDGQYIYRFAQDCLPDYGMRVHAFEITKLTKTTYEERQIDGNPILEGSGSGWNKTRMHHMDAHKIGPNQWLAAVDGYAGRRLVFDPRLG